MDDDPSHSPVQQAIRIDHAVIADHDLAPFTIVQDFYMRKDI